MLESYRRVFAHRGAAAFSAAGLLARLPIAMMTLGIVLLVSSTSGSYSLAGQISAAYVIGNAVVALIQGRLADRFGQTIVLYVDAVLFALFTGLLVHSIMAGWAMPWPAVWAALTGASMPQIGSMVRARWTNLVPEGERHTAFAVEAVVDELVFVCGPSLVTFLSTLHAPQTGLLVALASGVLGTVLLAVQRRTAPPPQPRSRVGGLAPMPWLRLLPIGIAAMALGAFFASMELITVAVSEDAEHQAAAGILLAVFSAGSLIAGVVAGAIRWRASHLRRFQAGMALLAGSTVVLPFVDDLVLLGVILFVVGMALAPTMIAVVSLLEATTPRSRLTEAMAVFQTGLSTGLAPGAWLAGIVADHTDGPSAYWLAVGCGLATAAAALACRHPAPRQTESDVSDPEPRTLRP